MTVDEMLESMSEETLYKLYNLIKSQARKLAGADPTSPEVVRLRELLTQIDEKYWNKLLHRGGGKQMEMFGDS